VSWTSPGADAAFAAELAQLQLQSGLSRFALAEQVGIQTDEVEFSEAGQRPVDVVELFLWCQACGSSLDAFAHRIDQRLASVGGLTTH
jgi:transcriptional regulator with XRE-family HTH domain